MSMSRKNFQAMADHLKGCKPSKENNPLYSESIHMWNRIVWEMVNFCREQNALFDTGRFTAACGMDEES